MVAGPTLANSTLRVAHVITGLGSGGAEASLYRLLSAQPDPSRHVVISLTNRGVYADRLEALGVRVFTLGLLRGEIAITALIRLHRLFWQLRPDLTQAWMYHANVAASLARLTGAPTGPVCWNVRHALDAWSDESAKLHTIVRLNRALAWQPARIVYNSHRAAEQHTERGFPRPIAQVIPNGVDTERFAPSAKSRAALRHSIGVEDSATLVGLIARVDPLKDHATFLRAAERFVQLHPEAHFLLAGTDTESTSPDSTLDIAITEATSRTPALHGRVHRLGQRDDMPSVYNACDIVSMTSRSEGSPNAVAEAMACGVPCVVTNVGDAARLVGETGIVVSVGDDSAIAERWRLLATKRPFRLALGLRAMERIRTHYSTGAEVSAYARIWNDVLPRHRTSGAPSVPDVRPPRALMVTTVPVTLSTFLAPHARYLRERGWQVDALAAGAHVDGELRTSFHAVFSAPWARRAKGIGAWLTMLFRAPREVRAVVRQGGYDVVHVHTPIAAFLTRLALRHRASWTPQPRVIYTAHGFHANPAGARWSNDLFRTAERFASRWTDYLVVMNSYDEKLARRDRLVPEDRLARHHGIGVDTDQFRPRTALERSNTRQSLILEQQQPVIVVVAEFNRNKRQRDIIAAMVRLRDEASSTLPVVLFIGDGPRRASLTAMVKRLGLDSHIRFLGQRGDVADLVGSADALVLASKREGYPRCILEAMALEIPVIASAARGSSDLLADERGWLYPIGDVERLVDRIRCVLTDPHAARARAERAANWVRQTASFARIAEQHVALYQAAKRGRPLPREVTPEGTVSDGTRHRAWKRSLSSAA
ncbi:MAG: glycosyltransferase [Gemmatimonadaceae bacterium]|nr:glycosyltransferase [Gemmatimonadaceae bacterium]